jgi:hypothetical protein
LFKICHGRYYVPLANIYGNKEQLILPGINIDKFL